MRLALVLSGGGMFGAWQAGAWSVLSRHMSPDLVVGASVGALNGYAIAAGATPEDLRKLWLAPRFRRIRDLSKNTRELLANHRPRIEFAITATDLLRLKPRIFKGDEITDRHLCASCAIPVVLPQVRINGRLYSDGGLQNPLPVWAAVELGATHIVGLNALPEIPPGLLKPLVKVFRGVAGYHPPVPAGVTAEVIKPSRRLGTVREAIRWNPVRIERWIEQGASDAESALKNISFLNCLGR